MKRKIKAEKPSAIKQPVSRKAYENQLAEACEFMVKQITQRFENQAIRKINKSTEEKFADAQVGNFAVVFLNIAKKTERKLLSQFDDDRIDDLAFKIMGRMDNETKREFYGAVENVVGISTKELIATEGLKFTTNALILETSQWIKKLRDETIEMYTANSLRIMAQGGDLDQVINELVDMGGKRVDHARFTAVNQIQNFNAVSQKIRAENLGITEAIWRTSQDERVRPCHQVRDGKRFNLKEGLYASCDQQAIIPGVDYQCRCIAEYIIPSDDEGEE